MVDVIPIENKGFPPSVLFTIFNPECSHGKKKRTQNTWQRLDVTVGRFGSCADLVTVLTAQKEVRSDRHGAP